MMEVRLTTKIALGVLLGLSKSLYDGTFCYYNYCVIKDPKAGDSFWTNTGKEYITRASDGVDMTSYQMNLDDESHVDAKFDAKWSGPVYRINPLKVRLFEYLPTATFHKTVGQDSVIKIDAHLEDGRYVQRCRTLATVPFSASYFLVDG